MFFSLTLSIYMTSGGVSKCPRVAMPMLLKFRKKFVPIRNRTRDLEFTKKSQYHHATIPLLTLSSGFGHFLHLSYGFFFHINLELNI